MTKPRLENRTMAFQGRQETRLSFDRRPWKAIVPSSLQRFLLLVPLIALLTLVTTLQAAPRTAQPQRVREIFVPFDDLNVILESDVRRVFLMREQYEELLNRVRTSPDDPAPFGALVVAAEYRGKLEQGRTRLTGTLQIDVLRDGLQQVPLLFGGVGVRSATLDDAPAALARQQDGRISLFVEGRGRHTLKLDLLAPLQTTAAEQSLNVIVPTPPNTRLHFVVPGNVDVKSGAAVASRALVDGATHLELLPPRGPLAIVMSLNNRESQTRQVVVSRSVFVDEVTQGYERLHARVAMNVLYGETQQFRFALPNDFEVNQVQSPLLAQWAVGASEGQQVLTVKLREPASGNIPLNIALIKKTAQLQAWQMPRLIPLNVASQVAVVGLVAEQRITAEQIAASGLIPIGNRALTSSIPQSIFDAEPGAPAIRPVVTFYAPQSEYGLSARFVVPPAQHQVRSNLILTVSESQLALRAGFTVVPSAEKLFEVKIDVPKGWHVVGASGSDQKPLPFEQIAADTGSLLRIRLPGGAPAQFATNLFVDAVAVPDNWLSNWQENNIVFPAFVVRDAQQDAGAVSIVTQDDLIVRSDQLEGLTPLDRQDRVDYGLQNVPTTLAYFYDRQPYRASLTVERREPWVTARNYSFLTVLPDRLKAHYEVNYLVQQAAVRKLVLRLPANTPDTLSITGLGGLKLKEFSSEMVDDERHWTVLLAERHRGRIRLKVAFEQRLEEREPKNLPLPLIAAQGVSFQSGHVAVEGSPELDVQIITEARPVDVGELSDAQYMPDRRLLGAYAYGGAEADVKIDVFRHPGYALPSAIVERAEMVTGIAASGISQTVARYDLTTKASYLEIELPDNSNLWSALLDGSPTKPQRDGKRLLLSLPAKKTNAKRKLQVVFETSSAAIGLTGTVDLAAPKLYLRVAPEQPRAEVPVADVAWFVNLPNGYRITHSDGTVFTSAVQQRQSPLATVIKTVYRLAGGADPFSMYQNIQYARQEAYNTTRSMSARESARRARSKDGIGDYLSDDETVPEEKVTRSPVPPTTTTKPDPNQVDSPAATATTDRPTDGTINAKDTKGAAKIHEVPEAGQPGKPPARGVKRRPSLKSKLYWNKSGWALEGLSSLRIEVLKTNRAVEFQSLGVNPQLRATLIEDNRVRMLAVAVAMTILLIGLLLTRRPVRTRIRYIVAVVLVSSLLPLLTGWTNQFGDTFDLAFFAACLLIPYYLVAGLLGRFFRLWQGGGGPQPASASMAVSILLLLATVAAGVAEGAPPIAKQPPVIVQIAPQPAPVVVPKDAIIVPYDVGESAEISSRMEQAEKVLVPYDKYVELWNRAYPDKQIETDRPAVEYALSGGEYAARLEGEDFVLVRGHLDVDLFTDKVVSVPLALHGGVLTEAQLDGQPARLRFVQPAESQNRIVSQNAMDTRVRQQQTFNAQVARPNPHPAAQQKTLVVLLASGKGRHRLDLAIRLPLTRRGGWRLLSGNIPAAPATAVTLEVPLKKTEMRLSQVNDRGQYETVDANESIETVLGAAGRLHVEWRPRVAEGTVDHSLTAHSQAVFDVRQDGTQLMWQLTVDFGRTERQTFTVTVPSDYLIERIVGENVSGWKAKPAAVEQQAVGQQVEIDLLKATQGQQRVTLQLARHTAFSDDQTTQFDTPAVSVVGAALHRGNVTVRRSPILELQTVERDGVTRMDTSADASRQLATAIGVEPSPLGIKDFEAYRFVTTPFRLRLSAARIVAETSAKVQSIVRVATRETTLESLIRYQAKGRPVFQAKIALPADLDLNNRVRAPEPFEWSVTKENDLRVLSIHMGVGQLGEFPVFVGGTIEGGTGRQTAVLPQLKVLEVARQEGDIVVQVDPAFDVRAENIQNCENVLPQRVHSWLIDRRQRELARLVLRYRGDDYAGSLVFTSRQPRVTCRTISNVKITDSTIEETILLDFTIRDAGIRQVAFTLPAAMKASRISAPELRQTTITPVEGQARVRVQLDLQDDIMGQFGVKIVHDHLLADQTYAASIPEVQTGQTERRFVILENAGRDEVIVDKQEGLELLSRQQQQWRELAALLGNQLTQAYIVRKGAPQAQLTFSTRERTAVETARATIGLARARLIIDGSGAYRGVQEYRMDNEIEQFLEIELPDGADLWSASVAGANVKPIEANVTGAKSKLQIPLIKTAQGDLDYAVILKYGGSLGAPGNLQTVGFPLIRTVNINVETSQVRLHLPRTHKWIDFGGDMKLATDADLAAGQLSYNTQCFNRLSQVLSGGDEYAKARAITNYKSLNRENVWFRNRQADLEKHNEDLQSSIGMNSRAVSVVENQLKQIGMAKQGEPVSSDNRMLLDEAWGEQRNERANDVVKELDNNFDYSNELTRTQGRGLVPDQQAGEVGQQFNLDWAKGNGLLNESMTERSTGEKGLVDRYQYAPQAPAADRGKGQGGGYAVPQTDGRFGPGNDTDQALEQDEFETENVANKARRYQEKLEQRESERLKSLGGDRGREDNGAQRLADPSNEGDMDDSLSGTLGRTASIPGMTSLDVEFPARGQVYLFTTPRGNAAITARAISAPLLGRLQSLAWVIGIVVVSLIGSRWIRRGGLAALNGRHGGITLMVLGIACLLTSIFPWAGLLAILIGVCLFFSSRKTVVGSQ